MDNGYSIKGKGRRVYIAGDMLNRGAILQRNEEAAMVKKLGHSLYNPVNNKSINDKANTGDLPLAERIVEHDTNALMWSDTVVIEPLVHAVGTCVELGQLKGIRDLAGDIVNIIADSYGNDPESIIEEIREECLRHHNRKILPHCSDIRRQNTDPQSGDRREFGFHQYVYGVCLDLTDGKGMYSMEEIEEELKQ